MTHQKIAVPSNSPGGLEGERSDHFGHCDLFTIVTLRDKEIVAVETLSPPAHGPGGCLTPISLLKEQEINAIVVSGMGKRPLAGFQEAGIEVFWAPKESSATVRFQAMAPAQTCAGHNCQAH